MTDSLSKAERSKVMSKVRSADTKPEWILRCALHRLGFRYRLRNRKLPGRPDLVLSRYNAAIFVHGCYWHRHLGCSDASIPKTNAGFWARKFAGNVERDRRVEMELGRLGWRVLVVWECELTKSTVETIRRVATWLVSGAYGADGLRYDGIPVDGGELLAVAEDKVRYRIASYDKSPSSDGQGLEEE